MKYILGIDQSTQGTKALLFDDMGKLVARSDIPHKQIIDAHGWVGHDPEVLYQNTLECVRRVLNKSGVLPQEVSGVGITNQRETAVAWNRSTGEPACQAIVWQCARAEAICNRFVPERKSEIRSRTGLPLSPYFSAGKFSWILENVPKAKEWNRQKKLCLGTVDSWILFRLTGQFQTDYSNASRTQLFNIHTLSWDETLCRWFGISIDSLAEVKESDSFFAETDFEGIFPHSIPIHAVMGDSHAALFGQGCLSPGGIKATFGTGSSVMLNIGKSPVFNSESIVTSLAWNINGCADYVLEGNLNYTGAIIRWLDKDLGLLSSSKDVSRYAEQANPDDTTYLVPAFSGLGAPYWDSDAKAAIIGMTRSTGKAEIIKAAEESIAYQISDLVYIMKEVYPASIDLLRVDGGATRDRYLMQFQSDILDIPVEVSKVEELSGMGVTYAAALAMNIYTKDIFSTIEYTRYYPTKSKYWIEQKRYGWISAVQRVLCKGNEPS